MDHSAPVFDPDVRQWRTATLVASGIAVLELVLLLALAVIAFGRPLLHGAKAEAARKVAAPAPAKEATTARRARPPAPPATRPRHVAPKLSRGRTSVLVLNGNGRDGAAAAEAQVVRSRGYVVASVGDARKTDYSRSLVMFRPGYQPEAIRLARDLRIGIVTTLDGLRTSELLGAQLTVIVGR